MDAFKGLKLKMLPPILSLHLKRFDLNYQTLQRIKLNDYVSFPMILNMNQYLYERAVDIIRKNSNLSESISQVTDEAEVG